MLGSGQIIINNRRMGNEDTRMKKKMIKLLNIIVDVLIVFILVISVMLLTMVLTSRSGSGVPNIFGKAPITILSDSMHGDKPDCFDKDDLIICDIVESPLDAEYKVGDIVSFRQDLNGDGEAEIVTHRIYRINPDGSYQTKGDNNETFDQDPNINVVFPDINKIDILATYTGTKLNGIGGIINYLQSPEGFFLVILLPMIIFFIYQAVRVVINAMAYSKEKGFAKAQEAIANADLTEEQKQKAIAEYLAA
jgi:signal peptidase